MMEGENGFEVVEKLKRDPETTDIPVIFLTGIEKIESKIKGFDLGAVDYIVKPFHELEVLARVRLHIKLSIATNVLISNQAEKLKQIKEAQTSLLITPEELPAARFGVYYSSLEEAGGDFYDVLSVSDNIFGYFVGDISGHDIKTSFITSALKVLLKQNCTPAYSPDESMKIINKVLLELLPKGKFLTACYIRLNRGQMKATVLNAGHPPVLYCPLKKNTRIIENIGDLLGMFESVSFDPVDIPVEKGDRFYIFTDGLFERSNEEKSTADYYGDLIKAGNMVRELSVDEAVKKLKLICCGKNYVQEDDILILGFEV
jgi:sigma-B regulation protein RsbU (phosphoserine phosphatase)